MIYKANIHKRKIYIRPRPKEDIPEGLVIKLNKPREGKEFPFIKTDIKAFKKEYALPEFPQDIWVISVYINNGGTKQK